jgi:hypothetical protein
MEVPQLWMMKILPPMESNYSSCHLIFHYKTSPHIWPSIIHDSTKEIIYKTEIKIDQVHTFNMYKDKVKKVKESSKSTIMYTHTQNL